VSRLDARTVGIMNNNTPTVSDYNEAFSILDEIADDAMGLAEAAECFAPCYIKKCAETALEFHPAAKHVKVLENGNLEYDDGKTKMLFEFEVFYALDEMEISCALSKTSVSPSVGNMVASKSDAIDLVIDIAEEAIQLADAADRLTVEDLPEFLAQVAKAHPLAARLKVVDYGDVVYEHGDVFIHVEFETIWDNQVEPRIEPDSSVTGIPDDN
jgi:hypothetical protein